MAVATRPRRRAKAPGPAAAPAAELELVTAPAPAAAPRPARGIDHEIAVWCEDRGRERWFARLWDRLTSQHCGGAGDNALEAIAWAMDAYVRQAVLGRPPQIACHPDARPGDGLELEAA